MLTNNSHFCRAGAAAVLASAIAFAAAAPASAQHRKPDGIAGGPTTHPANQPSHRKTGAADGQNSVTHHVLKINGRELRYTATAGFLAVRGDSPKPEAEIFYVSYVLDGERPADRPLTFAFNGGPGASSMWVHLGAMGPRRIVLPKDGTVLPRHVRLVDNEQSWLPFTDLVFVDPVGCGYSRSAPGVDAKKFFSVDGDVRVLAEFIRLYVSSEGRWPSPKFLAGESYGTTRSAGLAQQLQSRDGMNIRGLVLMSSALNFGTFSFSGSNDLPYVLYLPTYTAEAWYHKKLPADLQKHRSTRSWPSPKSGRSSSTLPRCWQATTCRPRKGRRSSPASPGSRA